jgi:hypothetical protein|tara:strand:+ start:267 stop:503 length:237 start_codon:yes stop_codon:yes gene_type:complete
MFTNEFDADSTITTILDTSGEHDDVQLIIGDDYVCIRQFNDEIDGYETVITTHKMFKDMLEAMNHTEGFFVTKYTRSN